MTETTVSPKLVSPKPPLFDFSTATEVQRAKLALFGIFMVFPTAVMSFMLTGIYIGPGFAIAGGLGAVMFLGGFLGYWTIVVENAVRQVQIKVVQDYTP